MLELFSILKFLINLEGEMWDYIPKGEARLMAGVFAIEDARERERVEHELTLVDTSAIRSPCGEVVQEGDDRVSSEIMGEPGCAGDAGPSCGTGLLPRAFYGVDVAQTPDRTGLVFNEKGVSTLEKAAGLYAMTGAVLFQQTAMARRCGLHDPVAFAVEVLLRNRDERPEFPVEYKRRTGRTTRALLEVLERAERGERVVYVTHNEGMRNYVEGMLCDLSRKTQIDVSKVQVLTTTQRDRLRTRWPCRSGVDTWISDHVVLEGS